MKMAKETWIQDQCQEVEECLRKNNNKKAYQLDMYSITGCIRFWGRLDQNFGFHGNRKPPLTYNGENDVSTFSRLFLI